MELRLEKVVDPDTQEEFGNVYYGQGLVGTLRTEYREAGGNDPDLKVFFEFEVHTDQKDAEIEDGFAELQKRPELIREILK